MLKKDLFALRPVSATTFEATCYGCITDHESSACAQRGHVARKISTHLELSRPGDTSTTSMRVAALGLVSAAESRRATTTHPWLPRFLRLLASA